MNFNPSPPSSAKDLGFVGGAPLPLLGALWRGPLPGGPSGGWLRAGVKKRGPPGVYPTAEPRRLLRGAGRGAGERSCWAPGEPGFPSRSPRAQRPTGHRRASDVRGARGSHAGKLFPPGRLCLIGRIGLSPAEPAQGPGPSRHRLPSSGMNNLVSD